jgi:hypothetical protein
MSDDKFNATVTAHGRTVEFKSALMSGIPEDDESGPMAMFVGRYDLGEFGIMLMCQLRAVNKILTREFEMGDEQAEGFVGFCYENAIRIEDEAREASERGEPFGEHILKMTKDNS